MSGIGLTVAPIQEAIVVSATRTEAPLAQLASSATVIGAAEIERRQQPPLTDLLRGTPGAVVVANGTRGAVASLFLRGGESNYTKVLLDGIPLNEPGGTFDFGGVSTAEPRAHRDRARGTVGAVRIGCDGRRDPAVHDARVGARPAAARPSKGAASERRARPPAPPAKPASSTTPSASRTT